MKTLLSRTRDLIHQQPYHLMLPFTCVWIIKPFYQGSRMDWTALAIAWPLFLVLYVLSHANRRFAATSGIWGLTLLGILYVPFNPEASGIFAFVAAIHAARLPRWCLLWSYLFGLTSCSLRKCSGFHLNLWTWIGGGSGALLFSFLVLLNARERESNLQLRLAQAEIGRLAKLTERERITRDLHDVLGHTLSLIAVKSELAQKRFNTNPQATFIEAQQIELLSREALVRVRGTINGYSTASFLSEMDRISAALTSVGLKAECKVDGVEMTSMQESVFAMTLQEAATNIIRHAHAGCCTIELHSTQGAVHLSVADDGRGSPEYDGFGLRGMQERLRLMGGSLQRTAEHGTRLQACLPRS